MKRLMLVGLLSCMVVGQASCLSEANTSRVKGAVSALGLPIVCALPGMIAHSPSGIASGVMLGAGLNFGVGILLGLGKFVFTMGTEEISSEAQTAYLATTLAAIAGSGLFSFLKK